MLSLDEARALDRLTIGHRATEPLAAASGMRRARTGGRGVEFHDFRRYRPGDDPRSIDWKVEARLRQLVVRVSRADGHLPLHVLLDVSGSMGLGEPVKLDAARKFAATLAYAAIHRRDPAGIGLFDSSARPGVVPGTGRLQLQRIYACLQSAAAGGRSNVSQALIDYAGATTSRGVVVVISDFFEPETPFAGLRYLLHTGFAPAVVQCVSPQELTPDFGGDFDVVDLVDAEDREGPVLSVDRAALDGYRRRLESEAAALAEFCAAHGIPYMRLSSAASFDQLLDGSIRAGLLGTHR
jgi:uncharacterized protein (DUF58 family)